MRIGHARRPQHTKKARAGKLFTRFYRHGLKDFPEAIFSFSFSFSSADRVASVAVVCISVMSETEQSDSSKPVDLPVSRIARIAATR